MAAIKSQHSRLFEQLLAERKQQWVNSLMSGTPADYETYRQMVGLLQGLDEALKISEEVDFKLSGEEPDAGA